MPGLRLQLRTACVTCGNPIPLSDAALSLACPTCDAPNRLSPSDFRWIIESRMKTPPTPKAGEGQAPPKLLGEAGVALVACGKCGAKLDEAAIEAAFANGAHDVTCRCGQSMDLRAVPPELDSEGWWTAFVGESAPRVVPAATEPVRFTCPHCGAGLMVDGTTRTPACVHCGTRPYLPDDLWLAVRPTPKAQSFYLWVDPTWYQEWNRLMARRVKVVFWTVVLVMALIGAFGAATAFIDPLKETIKSADGPVPWYERAFLVQVWGWMIAGIVGSIVAHKLKPRRTRGQ